MAAAECYLVVKFSINLFLTFGANHRNLIVAKKLYACGAWYTIQFLKKVIVIYIASNYHFIKYMSSEEINVVFSYN